jgi:hypothetical protein
MKDSILFGPVAQAPPEWLKAAITAGAGIALGVALLIAGWLPDPSRSSAGTPSARPRPRGSATLEIRIRHNLRSGRLFVGSEHTEIVVFPLWPSLPEQSYSIAIPAGEHILKAFAHSEQEKWDEVKEIKAWFEPREARLLEIELNRGSGRARFGRRFDITLQRPLLRATGRQ